MNGSLCSVLCFLMVLLLASHTIKHTQAATPVYTCYGIASTNASVCSGRGTCVANNVCQCLSYSNDSTAVDYVKWNSTWGYKFGTPTPNTLFSAYSKANDSNMYNTISYTTKSASQDGLWNCARGDSELILNTIPTDLDRGNAFSEFSFEATMTMDSRHSYEFSGMILWRDTSLNGGKNWDLGIGPLENYGISAFVNYKDLCSVGPSSLASTEPYKTYAATYGGNYQLQSSALVFSMKVVKDPMFRYLMYYKLPAETAWTLLGVFKTDDGFDKIGFFARQWSVTTTTMIFWTTTTYGGPVKVTLNGMKALVPRFTGSKCEIPYCYGIAANSTKVCNYRNGTCTDDNLCKCNQGWTGLDCKIPMCGNYTYTDPLVCSGAGNCSSAGCSCKSGRNGTLCEGFTCKDMNYCSGRGTCVGLNTCNCNAGYSGSKCEIYYCSGTISNSTSVCSKHGSCIASDTCKCDAGYSGNDCQDFSCKGKAHDAVDVCSGNGVCTEPESCKCQTNYAGSNCELFICSGTISSSPSVCSGKGTCIGPNMCLCNLGYKGEQCQDYYCYGKKSTTNGVCSGHGNCTNPDSCVCQPGYYGDQCESYKCYERTGTAICSSNGNCTAPNTCQCKVGYEGNECQTFTCGGVEKTDASVCSGKGECLGPDDCYCNDGFEGDICENVATGPTTITCGGIGARDADVCSGRGKCTKMGCRCDENYKGQLCEEHFCYGIHNTDREVCSGHGECISHENCTCTRPYFGEQCDRFTCDGIESNDPTVCNSAGICYGPDQCACYDSTTDHFCSSTPMIVVIPEEEVMYMCNEVLSNDTRVCNGSGTCTQSGCVCLDGYIGPYCAGFTCFDFSHAALSSCSGHGKCIDVNWCECDFGYFGDQCENYSCNDIGNTDPAVCNGTGLCIAPELCQCNTGYDGMYCDIFTGYLDIVYNCSGILSNDSKVCNGHGDCIHDACTCDMGFKGENCETWTCFGYDPSDPVGCSNHGICDNLDYCQCLPGYYGYRCESFSCFGFDSIKVDSCNGYGDCIGPDRCRCFTGYAGESCFLSTVDLNDNSTYTCGGLPSDDPTVCSGKGKCTVEGCVCLKGYRGELCETVTCDGVKETDSKVCSSAGKCVDLNTCVCSLGYSGYTCNEFTCFGVDSKYETVCNGTGTCVAPNICSCKKDYTGSNCEIPKCNGKSEMNGGCSMNGQCVKPNQCVCNGNRDPATFCSTCLRGYSGNNCEDPICFTIKSSDKNVCSGKGSCYSPNNCTCQQGFYGPTCSSFSCYGIDKNNPKVCGKHGTCTSLNTCSCASNWNGSLSCETCSPEYQGQNCDQLVCDPVKTCNNHGQCNQQLKCDCTGNFAGKYCKECKAGFVGPNCDVVCSSEQNCTSHGICSSNGTCVCNGNFVSEHCDKCLDGWSGINCDYKVIADSFAFNSKGDKVSGTVFMKTASKITCNMLMDDYSLSLIGNEAVCNFISATNTLEMNLSPLATIIPGSVLHFFTNPQNKLETVNAQVSVGSFITIPPVSSLTVDKSIVSTCDKITFDASGSQSLDRRALSFVWKSSSGPNQLASDKLDIILSSFNTSGVVINAKDLEEGLYVVTVNVMSAFGGVSSQSVRFTVVNTVVPTITVPSQSKVMIGFSSLINPIAVFPACFQGDFKTLKFSYEVGEESVDPTLIPKESDGMLVFSPSFTDIRREGEYDFIVTAQADKAKNASAHFTVKAIAQPLDVSFTISDMSQGYDDVLKFDVIKKDPSATLDEETLSVDCFNLLTATSCGDNVSLPYSEVLEEGSYVFTASYSKGSREVSATLNVKVLSLSKDKVIRTFITAQPQGESSTATDLSAMDANQNLILSISTLDTLKTPKYKWSSPELDLSSLDSTTSSFIVIPSSLMQAGWSYHVKVETLDGDRSGVSEMAFSTNFPPTKGLFEAFPKSGSAMQEFDLKCGNGWTDTRLPLSYQFFMFDGKLWQALSEKTADQKSIRVRLPAGLEKDMLQVKAVVTNAKGAFTESIIQVEVKPLSASEAVSSLKSLANIQVTASVASSALGTVLNMAGSSKRSSQVELQQASAGIVDGFFSLRMKQQDLVPETTDSAQTGLFVIHSGAMVLKDATLTRRMEGKAPPSVVTMQSQLKKLAIGAVNKDYSLTASSITNMISATGNLMERALKDNYADDVRDLLGVYDMVLSVQTMKLLPDMPSTTVQGFGFTGYSRILSVNNVNGLAGDNFTMSSLASSLLPTTCNYVTVSVKTFEPHVVKYLYESIDSVASQLVDFNLIIEEESYSVESTGGLLTIDLEVDPLIDLSNRLECVQYQSTMNSFVVSSNCTIQRNATEQTRSIQLSLDAIGVFVVRAIANEQVTPQESWMVVLDPANGELFYLFILFVIPVLIVVIVVVVVVAVVVVRKKRKKYALVVPSVSTELAEMDIIKVQSSLTIDKQVEQEPTVA